MTLTPDNDARPWDVDYDAKTDRAFLALTNGTIAVFDEVTAKMATGLARIVGEDRLIMPTSNGAPLVGPTNMHGIDYDPMSDSLIVSDVGSAASATDGKIFVLPGAGSSDGMNV
jgi:hypothetical protein